MLEHSQINYIVGNSILHKLDARSKLLSLIAISVISFKANFYALVLLNLLLLFLMFDTAVPFKHIVKSLKLFFVMLIVIFLIKSLKNIPPYIFQYKFIYFSKSESFIGALFVWRLLVIVLFSILFIITTKTKEIKTATYYYLKFIPFVPAKKIAFMMSLILRFIPVLFKQFRILNNAQVARNIELKKNPFYKFKSFLFPFMRLIFKDAENLTFAIEARNYSENRTEIELTFSNTDKKIFLIMICFMFLVFFI